MRYVNTWTWFHMWDCISYLQQNGLLHVEICANANLNIEQKVESWILWTRETFPRKTDQKVSENACVFVYVGAHKLYTAMLHTVHMETQLKSSTAFHQSHTCFSKTLNSGAFCLLLLQLSAYSTTLSLNSVSNAYHFYFRFPEVQIFNLITTSQKLWCSDSEWH